MVNGLGGRPPHVQPLHFTYESGRDEVVTLDDPAEKAALLNRQVDHFQPEGGSAKVAVG